MRRFKVASASTRSSHTVLIDDVHSGHCPLVGMQFCTRQDAKGDPYFVALSTVVSIEAFAPLPFLDPDRVPRRAVLGFVHAFLYLVSRKWDSGLQCVGAEKQRHDE